MIWFVVAWLLERAHLKISAFNYGAEFNGLGAVDKVLARKADAPMAYRVLVPWIVGLVERIFPRIKPYRLVLLYEPLKIALAGGALWVLARYLGAAQALFVAACLSATFLFDYWDWAAELFGLATAFSGSVWLCACGGLIAALSRPETAPLVAATYWLNTRDTDGALWVVAATVLPMAVVRSWAGNKSLYVNTRWTARPLRVNWHDVKRIGQNRPFYLGEIAMSLGVTGMVLWVVLSGQAGGSWPVPLALLAAGWGMARAAETRIFASCLLWVSFLIGG